MTSARNNLTSLYVDVSSDRFHRRNLGELMRRMDCRCGLLAPHEVAHAASDALSQLSGLVAVTYVRFERPLTVGASR